MKFYLTERQVPELRGLPKLERVAIRRRASGILASDTRWPGLAPTLLSAVGGVIGAFASVQITRVLVAQQTGTPYALLAVVCCWSCVAACGAAGGFIGAVYLLHRLRPYIRRVVNHEMYVA